MMEKYKFGDILNPTKSNPICKNKDTKALFISGTNHGSIRIVREGHLSVESWHEDFWKKERKDNG